jgi:hypothetical protein
MLIDPSRFRTGVVRQAYGYWTAKCTGGRLPGRADIRPEEMRHLLPWVFLVDVEADPVRFRYRLVGSEITRLAGVEYTGAAINEAEFGPHWRRVFDDYLAVVRSGVPGYVDGSARWGAREFLHHERIVMPLSSDGTTIDMLFGALHPTDPPDD